MPSSKITKNLARRLSQSKGAPVSAIVFAAIDSDRLTLESFAARARERDTAVRERLSAVMERIHAWEKSSGQSANVEFRPNQAAAVVTGPAALFEALAEDDAVSVLDVE
jgi:hypothetical protein